MDSLSLKDINPDQAKTNGISLSYLSPLVFMTIFSPIA